MSSASRARTSSTSSNRIHALLPELRASLPAGVDVAVLTDRTTTIRASVEDVEFEMILAVVLVVLVIFLFLRDSPATLIPSLSVPLSLIGTFAVMYLAEFSLNNLSLMALTIATGFVVDDAIVMIENISRYIEQGERPLQAALKGAGQIGFTIISLTVSLIAVLIPLLFMQDVVGRLFREFAVTLAVTILISAVVSLTLVPMLCAKLLQASAHRQGTSADANGRWFARMVAWYGRKLTWVLDHQRLTLWVAVATLVITAGLYMVIPKGFFPEQDTGLIQGVSEATEGRCRMRPWPSASRRWPGHSQGPGCREPVLVHRRRWQQRHSQQRPLPDQPEAAGDRSRRPQRRHPSAAQRNSQRPGHHAVHAAGPGPDPRQHRSADPIQLHARERGPGCAFVLDTEAHRSAAAEPELSGCGQQPGGQRACRAGHNRQGQCRAGWVSAWAPSITRCMTRSASESSRQSSPRSNQYRVILEADPESYSSIDALSSIYVPSAGGGQVPLSAIAKVTVEAAAAVDQPPGAVSGGHRVIQPGAGRLAGRGRRCDRDG